MNTCPKDHTYASCMKFNPVCRLDGKQCRPGINQLPLYITAYPVSVRSIVDKTMEVEGSIPPHL